MADEKREPEVLDFAEFRKVALEGAAKIETTTIEVGGRLISVGIKGLSIRRRNEIMTTSGVLKEGGNRVDTSTRMGQMVIMEMACHPATGEPYFHFGTEADRKLSEQLIVNSPSVAEFFEALSSACARALSPKVKAAEEALKNSEATQSGS